MERTCNKQTKPRSYRRQTAAIALLCSLALTEPSAAQTSCPNPTLASVKEAANIATTFKAAKLIRASKGQFETTTAYDARMKSAAAALAPQGTLTVVLSPDPSSFSFDADKAIAGYSNPVDECMLVTFIRGEITPDLACLRQKISVTRSKPHIMRNAFGTAVPVITVATVDIGVTSPPTDPANREGPKDETLLKSFSFGATVPEAISLKKNALLVVTLKPEAPFYVDATWSTGATIDNPVETSEKGYLLAGRLLCASIIDKLTGKVFQTQDLTKAATVQSEAAAALKIEEWITSDDVPTGAAPKSAGAVTISISKEGRVESCAVKTSSGDLAIDELGCTLIRRRARFSPARSEAGLPLSSTRTVEIPWIEIARSTLPPDEKDRF